MLPTPTPFPSSESGSWLLSQPFCFETGSGLISSMLALDFQFTHLSFPGAEITGVCHDTWCPGLSFLTIKESSFELKFSELVFGTDDDIQELSGVRITLPQKVCFERTRWLDQAQGHLVWDLQHSLQQFLDLCLIGPRDRESWRPVWRSAYC